MDIPSKKNRAYVQFGSPDSSAGAIVAVHDLKGAVQLEVDLLRFQLSKWGIPITSEVEARLEQMEKELLLEWQNNIAQQGVPEKFKQLFAAAKKRDATRLAGQMALTQKDMANLLFNCDQIGYSKESKHPKFLPEGLKPTNEETNAFFSNGIGPLKSLARKHFNKITASFTQRRCVSAHMLSNGSAWHLFYFSYEDAFKLPWGAENHWRGGTHIHYISHLWGLKKETIWAKLDERQFSLPSIHIQYDADVASKQKPSTG